MVKDDLSRPSELYPVNQATKYFFEYELIKVRMPFQIGPLLYFWRWTVLPNKDSEKRVVLKKGFQILHGCCQLAEQKDLCKPYNAN